MKRFIHVSHVCFCLLQLLFAVSAIAQAQSITGSLIPMSCVTLEDGNAYYLKETRKLADAIPEQASSNADEQGVFHLGAIFTPPYSDAQRILLSGSEQGSGFVVDDILSLETIPADKVRFWDFSSADRMRIVPVDAPQDITDLFLPDTFNMVQVTLQDLRNPVFRSSDLWLLVYSPCYPPVPTATSTRILIPTATAFVLTSTPTATAVPPTATATAIAMPTATMTATPEADLQAPTQNPPLRISLLAAIVIGLGLVFYGWWVVRSAFTLPGKIRPALTFATQNAKRLWEAIKAYFEERMK